MGRITDAGKRKPQMLDIVLTGIHVRSPHALELTADRLPDPITGEMLPFTFRPGQWVYLIDAQGFRADQRAFSLASAPSEATIELGIEIVPGGLFTPRVLQWRIGDEFTLRGPYGTFQLQEPLTQDLLLIGGNAGVVPLRSFVRHLAASPTPPNHRVCLLACHHHQDLAFYDEEFRTLMSAHAWFEYQPMDTGVAAPGTLPQALHVELTERNQDMPNLCYVAGVKAFTSAVEAILTEVGVPPGQLAIERFD
ncbi:MAG: Dihydroorotate dehydrogenase B (NAD(+)), electron transfer subunit [bacterium]|nr:Dihydroorotate dehydrogenase B (NAD(+)), electron transfer subunit [bacterium]